MERIILRGKGKVQNGIGTELSLSYVVSKGSHRVITCTKGTETERQSSVENLLSGVAGRRNNNGERKQTLWCWGWCWNILCMSPANKNFANYSA